MLKYHQEMYEISHLKSSAKSLARLPPSGAQGGPIPKEVSYGLVPSLLKSIQLLASITLITKTLSSNILLACLCAFFQI